MAEGVHLIETNKVLLDQGIDVLSSISDAQYKHTNSKYYQSCIGKHMRHILEHYMAFTASVSASRKIDYDDRKRDQQIEKSRSHAIQTAESMIGDLSRLGEDRMLSGQPIKVKNNENGSWVIDSWSGSSIERELQFLISHTVHHYALIAIILRIQGIRPDEKFGIAPSTLRYRKQFNRSTG
ncbi:MAG: DinB family protein [Balneolaceae bacterium]|nr:DinB family protein [Balneolaceae bacterium]